MSINAQRTGEYVITVGRQQSVTDTATAGEAAAHIVPTEASPETIHAPSIEDPAMTLWSGKRPPITGLISNAEPSLSIRAEGCRVAAPTASSPITAQTHLICGVLQSEAVAVVDTSFTGGSVTAVTATGADPSPNDIGLALFEDGAASGSFHPRPYTHEGISDDNTFLMEMPSADATGEIRMGHQIQWARSWSALPYPLSVIFNGMGEHKTRRINGAVASLSIGDFGPDDPPTLDFSFLCGEASDMLDIARPTPEMPRGRVFACSDLLLGVYGQSALGTGVIPMAGTASMNIASEWIRNQNPNYCGPDDFTRGNQIAEVTLTVLRRTTPDDFATVSETQWQQVKDADTAIQWHLMVSYGQRVPTSTLAIYFPKLVLTGVEDGDLNGLDADVLTFGVVDSENPGVIVGVL